MCKKKNSNNNQPSKICYFLFIIIYLAIICVSPYIFKYFNIKFNKIFSFYICTSDYLNYMSSVFISSLAVIISVLAYNISKKSERREFQNHLHKINTSKRLLEQYIKESGQIFYNTYRAQGRLQDLNQIKDIENHIEQLHSYEIITDKERDCCRNIVKLVSEGLDQNRERSDEIIATEFCKSFLNTEYEAFQLNEDLEKLSKKLSINEK